MTLGFITWLLVFQLLGEVISKGLDLPLPGPVVGMALLFLALVVRGGVPDGLKDTASGLLKHLSLLFVPAGVGVMMHLHLIRDEWQAISAALVISTVVTIAVTALVMKACLRFTDEAEPKQGPQEGMGDE